MIAAQGNASKKRFVQKDFNGNIIKIWESKQEAVNHYGIKLNKCFYSKKPFNNFVFEYEQ